MGNLIRAPVRIPVTQPEEPPLNQALSETIAVFSLMMEFNFKISNAEQRSEVLKASNTIREYVREHEIVTFGELATMLDERARRFIRERNIRTQFEQV